MTEALPVLILLVTAAVTYLSAVRLIWRRRGRHIMPMVRAACFVLGLLVIGAALSGPLDDGADERFSLHMLQHALLVLVAAPLLVIGTPVTVLVLALSAAQRRRTTTPVLRSHAARFVLSPSFALAAFLVVLCGSHVPAIYDAATSNQALHDLEHLAYLVTAALFWMAVLGADPRPTRLGHPARLLFLFLAMAAMAVVGVALSMGGSPTYPHYVAEARDNGYSAVADQHTGGVIMWTAGMLVMVPVMAAVVLGWLAEDERRTVRLEQRQDLHRTSATAP